MLQRSNEKPQGKYDNVVTASELLHQHSEIRVNGSHPHCIHEVRESEVLMAKDSPTVPDGEVDVVPGKNVVELSLHYIVIRMKYGSCIWCHLVAEMVTLLL